jgi:ribosomal protein L37AE/L43A
MKDKGAMAIALDLIVDQSATTLCAKLDLQLQVYEEKPSICPECRCKQFREYEILGALPEPIVWECKKCEIRFPKYSLDKMEGILKKVQGLWTNPEDWGHVSKKDYN